MRTTGHLGMLRFDETLKYIDIASTSCTSRLSQTRGSSNQPFYSRKKPRSRVRLAFLLSRCQCQLTGKCNAIFSPRSFRRLLSGFFGNTTRLNRLFSENPLWPSLSLSVLPLPRAPPSTTRFGMMTSARVKKITWQSKPSLGRLLGSGCPNHSHRRHRHYHCHYPVLLRGL